MSVFIASYFEMQLSHYHFPIVYDVDSLLRRLNYFVTIYC